MNDIPLRETEAADRAQNRIMHDPVAMPPKIASAIAKIMGKIGKIAKDERNKQGGYNFTSIDAFLAATGPLCAEAGLIVTPHETSVEAITIKQKAKDGLEKYEDVTWFKASYQFTLSHESGETWEHRPARVSIVRASMGSQALLAAQSYALKSFMRSLFQIPTGDKEDTDQPPARPKSPSDRIHGPLSPTDLKARLRVFTGDLDKVSDTSELAGLKESYRELLDQCRRDLRQDWWEDFGDSEGIKTRMIKKHEELQAQEMANAADPANQAPLDR